MKPFHVIRPAILAAMTPALLALSGCQTNPGADAGQYPPSGDAYGNPPGYSGRTGGYPSESDYVDVAPVPPSAGGGTYQAPSHSSNPVYAPSQPSGSSSGAASGLTHKVQKGDTLYSLGRRYGTNVSSLKAVNGLSTDVIRIGQVLKIP